MRVLMLSDVYFPRVNGVSTSIETFRRELGAHGVSSTLVAPSYGDDAPQTNLLRIPARPVPRDPEDRIMHWRAAREALDALPAEHYDLIHIQTPFLAHALGTRLRRRWQVPLLATYHTLFEEYLHHYAPLLPQAATRGLARLISRRQCNGTDGVIAPSSAMAARLREYGVTTPIHVLPTGIPAQRFGSGNGARFRARYDLPADRPLALYVGRLAFEKNLSFLLDVAAHARQRRPELLILLAGDGPAAPALQTEVRQRGLQSQVRFVGYLDREVALPDCYAAADVFVFPSRTETQGLVLLEAMAAGLPVVCLAEMGVADVVAGCEAALTPRHDAAHFSEQLLQLLTDLQRTPSRRQALAQAARQHAARWSDDTLAGRLAALYRLQRNRLDDARMVQDGKPVQG